MQNCLKGLFANDAGIDFSQSVFNEIATVDFDSIINFDPFNFKEVI